jgi:chemotaxis signal transduction protein
MIDQYKITESLSGLVVFELDDKEFCADIRNISAILNPKEINKSNSEIASVSKIKLNGIQVPLIDLHKYFDVPRKVKSKNMRIILFEVRDKLFGFMVERVKEIFSMSRSFRNKIHFTPVENTYVLWKLDIEGRELLIPDFEKIIESSEEQTWK